jgi:hypothetical protein
MNVAHRRIGLHHVDKSLFGQLPTQQRPASLASLIPPIQSFKVSTANQGQSKLRDGCSVQNPYAASRKRSVRATNDHEDRISKSCHRHDVASIVLGRPRQNKEKDGTENSMMIHENELTSRKQHRRRFFRDRLEFGCSVEICNNDDTDNNSRNVDNITTQNVTGTTQPVSQTSNCLDGDIAGGAIMEHHMKSSNEEQSSTIPLSDRSTANNAAVTSSTNDVLEDDDDLLTFVAFPVTRER